MDLSRSASRRYSSIALPLALIALSPLLAPLPATGAPALEADDVRAELDAWSAELERPGLGRDAERLRAARDQAEADLAAGCPHAALSRIASGRVQTAALLFIHQHRKSVTDMEAFARLWRAHEAIPERAAARERLAPCARAPALVRGLVESASNRAGRHYHAARAIARANDEPGGGYFYLGRALAELDMARLCPDAGSPARAAAPAADEGPAADLRGAAEELRRAVEAAYADGDAAIDQHPTFIRLSASLKQLDELEAAGRRHGAVQVFLDAVLRLAELEPPAADASAGSTATGARLAEVGRRLAFAAGDHSIARAVLERGQAALERAGEDDLPLAVRIADRVMPAYLARLGPVDAPPAATARVAAAGPDPVTVTLLRWPYT